MHHEFTKNNLLLRFLYVIFFITLPLTVFSFSGIVHYAITMRFSDPSLSGLSFQTSSLQVNTAVLIVSFPVFATAFLWIQKNTGSRHAPERRYVFYGLLLISFFVLFLRAFFCVYDLIRMSLTLESFLHFFVDFIIMALIFGLSLHELRLKE